MKMKKLVISVTVWFLLLLFYMLKHSDLKIERRWTSLAIGTVENAAILITARAQ